MYIVGSGHAHGKHQIESSQILEIAPAASEIEEQLAELYPNRRLSLPGNYLTESKNLDVRAALESSTDSPTTLAAQAIELALQRAGISAQEVGLFIGASSTPFQTTPAESQRVAGALGLKVPAFDIHNGFTDILHQLQAVLNWKSQQVPQYVVCFSSNTVSHRINYSAGIERFLFGDAAAALVLSPSVVGPWKINSVQFTSNRWKAPVFGIPRFSHIWFDLTSYFNHLESCGAHSKASEFLAETLPSKTMDKLHGEGPLTPNALGASPFESFSEEWPFEKLSEKLQLSIIGPGYGFGRIEIERH